MLLVLVVEGSVVLDLLTRRKTLNYGQSNWCSVRTFSPNHVSSQSHGLPNSNQKLRNIPRIDGIRIRIQVIDSRNTKHFSSGDNPLDSLNVVKFQ